MALVTLSESPDTRVSSRGRDPSVYNTPGLPGRVGDRGSECNRLFSEVKGGNETGWRGVTSRYEAKIVKPLITLIVVAIASASLGQQAKSPASLQWANMASAYHRFEEIKPKLVNNGDVSIFLSRL